MIQNSVASDAVNGVLSRIDKLAEKLGTTAANVWTIYVAQARVEAIRDTFVSLVFLAVAAVLGIMLRSVLREPERDEPTPVPFLVAAGIFVALLFSCLWFYGAIGEWVNPQYWAFQHLTADIKQLF